MENRNCQNCKNDFTIEQDDFSFYEKIKVPPPTFCPECIMIQLLIWRNQRFLYKRKCSFSGENIISIYDADAKFPVYKSSIWKSDSWDPLSYGLNYNFEQNFFDQFYNLFLKVPKISINHIGNVVSSDYSNIVFDSKNIYLSSSVLNSENIYYSSNIDNSKNVFDSDNLLKCDECYECLNSEQCFNCNYVFDSRACIDSDYLFDCTNCQNCFMCANQRNKNYMILNEQYSREEYFKNKEQMLLESSSLLSKFIKFKQNVPHKFNRNRAVNNVTGDTTENSSNCKNVYLTYDSENIKNAIRVVKTKESMNVFGVGPNGNLLYQDLTCSLNTTNTVFSINISNSTDIRYSFYCSNSSNLFGCVGLKNASYCILNKQYSKDEYFKIVEKIIENMNILPYVDVMGRVYKYGDFFPFELSPFKYNETVALEYNKLDKNNALKLGFGWKDRDKSEYISNISVDQLPDSYTYESVKDYIIECQQDSILCSGAYKFSEAEVNFYIKHKLKLPKKCPMCRFYDRMGMQYPFKLFKRQCMCDKTNHNNHDKHCKVEFETTYSPERPEIVYCEKCYQQEVY